MNWRWILLLVGPTLLACGARSPLDERDAARHPPADSVADTAGMFRTCSCDDPCRARCEGAAAGCPDGVPCVPTASGSGQRCAPYCVGPSESCPAGATCGNAMLCDEAVRVCFAP